jgi:2-dehydro-3-deoxyphosphogluconate aldolase/(4S)-4-hydroxy-2-oxoglutarate aldolase
VNSSTAATSLAVRFLPVGIYRDPGHAALEATTMNPALVEALEGLPAIGIMRGCPPEHAPAIAAAARDAGLAVLEVTLDSPSPTESIAGLSDRFPDLVVGAGTVRTTGDVALAADAGARFVVCPIVSRPVLDACAARGLPCLPGAATPSEIWSALEWGAAAVKVFPARELGGPAFIRAVRDPLGVPPLVPTGGVGPDDAKAYLDAGAMAVGVGGSVFPAAAMVAGDATRVGSLAAELVEAIR